MASIGRTVRAEDYSFRLGDGLLGAQMLCVAFGSLVLGPVHGRRGYADIPDLYRRPGAGVSGLVVCLHRAHHLRRTGLGRAGHAGWADGDGFRLSAYFRVDRLARCWPYPARVPIVTGPVIMVIGLILAPVAVNLATGHDSSGESQLVASTPAMTVAFISLAVTLAVSLFGRGLVALLPILCGVTAGYLASLGFGLVDFSPVAAAPWLGLPDFVAPAFNWQAILFMLPVAIAPAIEHFGDIIAIRSVTGRHYLADPGIHRTMLGDGLATSMAAMLGGPDNTTYSEVTGRSR